MKTGAKQTRSFTLMEPLQGDRDNVEKEYVGEEDEVLWPHRPEERYGENTDARKDGRQAEKGQTSNDLVPGFERMDQAGHCWCITTGDRSG